MSIMDESPIRGSESLSRVDLDILLHKDKAIEFRDFVSKRAEETKRSVMRMKAIEYWNRKEEVVEQLQNSDQQVKPLIIYGHPRVWGTASFWEKMTRDEYRETDAGDENVFSPTSAFSNQQDDDREMVPSWVELSSLKMASQAFPTKSFLKNKSKLNELEQLEAKVEADDEEQDENEEEDENGELEEEEEEDEEEDGDLNAFENERLYCYKTCVTAPDGYVPNSVFLKNCKMFDRKKHQLIKNLEEKFTVYIKPDKETKIVESDHKSNHWSLN